MKSESWKSIKKKDSIKKETKMFERVDTPRRVGSWILVDGQINYRKLLSMLSFCCSPFIKILRKFDPSEKLITTKLHENYRRAVLNVQHLKVLESMIPKDQKNLTTLKWKYGATFYSCHTALDTCCCEV
jgi:hypothetical protein